MELHISITGDEASGKKVLAVLRSTTMTSTWMKYQKRFLERRWTNEQRTL